MELILGEDEFWISSNTPSSKNSKVWTGKFLVYSKVAARWIRVTKKEWVDQRLRFISQLYGLPAPYYIEFTFYRDSRRRFDYTNASQIVTDTMVEHGWLQDDDADNLKPYYGDYVLDKHFPGVKIKILKTKPIHYVNIQTHRSSGSQLSC